MSNFSNCLVPFNKEEVEKSEKPISIKISYTEEIYHGSELKSRIELNKCTEFPRGRIDIAPVKTDEDINPVTKKTAEIEELEESTSLKSRERSKMKTYNINKSKETPEKKSNCCFWLINILVVIFLSIFCGRYFLYTEPFSIDKIQTELHANVLNQDSAIATTILSLKRLQTESPVQILTCLVGPTGVGKTHLINILNQQMNSGSIKIYNRVDLPHLYDENFLKMELRFRLTFSGPLIIVLDDLKLEDLKTLEKFVEIAFSYKHTNILILTIFNIDTEGCLNNSRESTKNADIIKGRLGNIHDKFYYSHFNFLNEDTARMWLEKTLSARKVPSEGHEKIIDSLLEGQDIRCNGLKGLQAKLLLEI